MHTGCVLVLLHHLCRVCVGACAHGRAALLRVIMGHGLNFFFVPTASWHVMHAQGAREELAQLQQRHVLMEEEYWVGPWLSNKRPPAAHYMPMQLR